MKIGIDIDHTITASEQSVEFFSILTHLLIANNYIFIISNREPNTEQNIAEEIDYLGIEYNKIVITAKKAEYIKKHNITIYFENQDENFQKLKLEETLVFKIRESGNYIDGRWIGNKKTVKMIDE